MLARRFLIPLLLATAGFGNAWQSDSIQIAGDVKQPLTLTADDLAKHRGRGFFNTGATAYAKPNRGLAEFTGNESDIGKFRAPTLRNIAVTAPYMHDGSLATLEAVLDHYARGGRYDHPNKSRIVHGFRMSETDRRDLIEFLKSLTDDELLHDPRWSDPWPAAPITAHPPAQ